MILYVSRGLLSSLTEAKQVMEVLSVYNAKMDHKVIINTYPVIDGESSIVVKFHLKLLFRIHTRGAARYRRTPLGVVRRTCADVFGIALHIGLSPLFSVVSLCVGCSRCSVIILDWVYNCPVVCLATLSNCAICYNFISLHYCTTL